MLKLKVVALKMHWGRYFAPLRAALQCKHLTELFVHRGDVSQTTLVI